MATAALVRVRGLGTLTIARSRRAVTLTVARSRRAGYDGSEHGLIADAAHATSARAELLADVRAALADRGGGVGGVEIYAAAPRAQPWVVAVLAD